MSEKRKSHIHVAPAVIVAAGAAYIFALRPWHLRWGTTDEELAASLPGDAICPDTAAQVTHAITINAPPEKVWPWILQIGQDRGGFYSNTFLENIVGCEMRNTGHIVPEWQNREVGDTVWFATPKHFGGQAKMIAAIVEPQRAMVLATPAGLGKNQKGRAWRGNDVGVRPQACGRRKNRLNRAVACRRAFRNIEARRKFQLLGTRSFHHGAKNAPDDQATGRGSTTAVLICTANGTTPRQIPVSRAATNGFASP